MYKRTKRYERTAIISDTRQLRFEAIRIAEPRGVGANTKICGSYIDSVIVVYFVKGAQNVALHHWNRKVKSRSYEG